MDFDLSRRLAETRYLIFNAYDFPCEDDWRYIENSKLDYHLWYVIKGKGEVHINEETHAFKPGRLFLFQPRDRVSAEHSPPDNLHVQACHFMPLDRYFWNQLELPRVSDWPNGEIGRAFGDCLEFLAKNPVPNDSQVLPKNSFFLRIMAAFWSAGRVRYRDEWVKNQSHRTMEKILPFIEKNLSTRIVISDLAEKAGVDRTTLIKLFRRHLRTTPARYMLRRRLEEARRLLETGCSVKESAETLGFPDAFSFSKSFKACFQLSPKEYAKGSLGRKKYSENK